MSTLHKNPRVSAPVARLLVSSDIMHQLLVVLPTAAGDIVEQGDTEARAP